MIYYHLNIRRNRRDGKEGEYGRAWVDHLIYDDLTTGSVHPRKGEEIVGPDGETYTVTKVAHQFSEFGVPPVVRVEAR